MRRGAGRMRWVPVVMAGTLLVAGCSDPLRDEAGTGAAAGTDATPVAFEVRAGGHAFGAEEVEAGHVMAGEALPEGVAPSPASSTR